MGERELSTTDADTAEHVTGLIINIFQKGLLIISRGWATGK